ncbi:MAG: hypothetical protein E7401_00150 [Ruminococcaceae bacterium]|nr:hypothetical protein [Oscillospiraceae bacterium]
MFRKYYKAANDDIKPNRELIEKIFEKAEAGKSAKKVFRFKPGYGTALAAVLVLVMGIAALPQINPATEKSLEQSVQPRQIEAAEIKSAETVTEKTEESSVKEKAVPEIADLNNEIATEADEENTPSMARITPQANEICEFMITELSEVTEDERKSIENNLRQKFGEVDAETGNAFIFEIVGKSEFGGETVYVGRWRWWVKDHSSLLCEFVLNEQMTEMYECSPCGEGGLVKWTKADNLLD